MSDGDRVNNGLKLKDDYLSEKEIRAYISKMAEKEFDAERFIRLTQKTVEDLNGDSNNH